MFRGQALLEPGPWSGFNQEQIYFLTFVFLVRAAEP